MRLDNRVEWTRHGEDYLPGIWGLLRQRRFRFHRAVPGPLVIVSPLLPPLRGGLADHTRRLAETLAAHLPVHVLTSAGAAKNPAFEVVDQVTDWHDRRALESALGHFPQDSVFLWQYVPHMYGRGGVNFAIAPLISRLHCQGRRQVLIAHEIKAPLHWKPHWMFYALCHRLAWRQIRRAVPAIGISSEGWLESGRVGRNDPTTDFFVLPSPSNFPVVPVPDRHPDQWRAELGLAPDTAVVGYFGTLGAGKQPDWIFDTWRAANRSGIRTALAVIGGKPTVPVTPEEQALYRPLGYLDEPAVSRALQALDLLLLPFEDGVAERRTTITAGLAHGVPILTTLGSSTGSTLRAARFFAAASATDPQAFQAEAVRLLRDPAARARLSAAAVDAYARDFSWDVVARRLLARIRGPWSTAEAAEELETRPPLPR